MAINPETRFVGKITPSSAAYPYGEARDITVPGDGTGTPLVADLVNDVFGFQQALLAAGGVTPSGTPDTATTSQYFQALNVANDARYLPEFATVAALKAVNPVALGGFEASLKVGTRVTVSNLPSPYEIVASTSRTLDDGAAIALDNGNFAEARFQKGEGYIEQWGIAPTTATIDAAMAAADALGIRLLGKTDATYTYGGTARKTFTNKMRINLNGGKLLFSASADDHVFDFTAGLDLRSIVIDGGANYFCSVSGNQAAPIWATGAKSTFNDVKLSNFLGLQDRFQYGIQVDFSYDTDWQNCELNEIFGVTNTGATAGFCGGVFITNDPNNKTNIIESNHVFNGVNFREIRTLQNAALDPVAPDSDAIRLFIFDHNLLTAAQQNTIAISTVSINGSKWHNVLKSGAKIPYVSCVANDCSFTVDDIKTQLFVYAAVRMQTGRRLEVNNLVVSGPGIAIGALGDCDEFVVDGISMNSDYASADAVFCGTDSLIQQSDIQNIYLHDTAHAVTLSTGAVANIRGVYDISGTAIRQSVLRYLTPSKAYLKDVFSASPAQIAKSLNPSSTFSKLRLDNIQMTSAFSGELIDTPAAVGLLSINNSKLDGDYRNVISSSLLTSLEIDGLELNATGDNSRLINCTGMDSATVKRLVINDNRSVVSDYLAFIGANHISVDGVKMNVSPTTPTALIAAMALDGESTTTGIVEARDIYVEGTISNKQAVTVINTLHTRIGDLDLNYTTARISLVNCGQTILGWMAGKLSGTPVAISGTTVLNETAGTRVTY